MSRLLLGITSLLVIADLAYIDYFFRYQSAFVWLLSFHFNWVEPMQPSCLWLYVPSRLHSLCAYMGMGPYSTGIHGDLLVFTMCRAIPTCTGEAVGWRKHLVPKLGFSSRCNAISIPVGQAFSLGNVTFKMEATEVIAHVSWLMNALYSCGGVMKPGGGHWVLLPPYFIHLHYPMLFLCIWDQFLLC